MPRPMIVLYRWIAFSTMLRRIVIPGALRDGGTVLEGKVPEANPARLGRNGGWGRGSGWRGTRRTWSATEAAPIRGNASGNTPLVAGCCWLAKEGRGSQIARPVRERLGRCRGTALCFFRAGPTRHSLRVPPADIPRVVGHLGGETHRPFSRPSGHRRGTRWRYPPPSSCASSSARSQTCRCSSGSRLVIDRTWASAVGLTPIGVKFSTAAAPSMRRFA